MSLYTTGELAKKCGVSVRTVQYYDERGILVPTDLTEGGRRLFSEEDVATLETICFLRDLDISIKDIAEILESDESKKVIELLLNEQEKNIQKDVKRKTEQLEKDKLKKMYKKMVIIAIPLETAELVTFVIGILKGLWIPFFVALAVLIICAVFMVDYWYKQIEYICPECHTRFQPKKIEGVFGNHTSKMRRLTCPSCKRKIWSLEVYRKGVKP